MEDAEKSEPSHTAGGNVDWCNRVGKQPGNSYKVKHRVIILPRNSTPRYNICPHKYLYTEVHSRIIQNSQNKNNPSVHQLTNDKCI